MDIELKKVGKRYIRRWVFKDISYRIPQGSRIGVTGHNGSGKSTLLRILTGALPVSQGEVEYRNSSGEVIASDKVYSHFSFAAPYADLIEEMTIAEALKFHRSFREMKPGCDTGQFVQLLGSQFYAGMYLKSMSSGMKQRMRVALAIMTECDILVLDEPTSNLDEAGKAWFQSMLNRVGDSTTMIIASNESEDMAVCREFINIPDHLPSSSVSIKS